MAGPKFGVRPEIAMVRRTQAASLIEFALTLPILLALMLGVVDAGRGVVAQITISNAARECARYVAIHWRESSWWNPANALALQSAVGLDPADFYVSSNRYSAANREYSECTVRYTFRPATPLIVLLPGQLQLEAKSRSTAT